MICRRLSSKNFLLAVLIFSYYFSTTNSYSITFENDVKKLKVFKEQENELLEKILKENKSPEKSSTLKTNFNDDDDESLEIPQDNSNSFKSINDEFTSKNLRIAKNNELNNKKIKSESDIKKILENYDKMSEIVGVLADLKNILSHATAAQEKEISLRTEVDELREEVQFLRSEINEIKTMKAKVNEKITYENKEHNSQFSTGTSDSQSKNEERTINWIKSSFSEIRHEISELSSSLNITKLASFDEKIQEIQTSTTHELRAQFQQIEKLEQNQINIENNILELQNDVAEIKTHKITERNEKYLQNTIENSDENEAELLNLLKSANPSNMKISSRHHMKHMKSQIQKISKIVTELINATFMNKNRIKELEKTKYKSNNLKKYESLYKKDETLSDLSSKLNQNEKEITTIENELKEKTSSVFKVLEALESKFDLKFENFQKLLTEIAKSSNKVERNLIDMSEEQILIGKKLKFLSRDSKLDRKRVQESHLKIATLQTQLLGWGLATCLNEEAKN